MQFIFLIMINFFPVSIIHTKTSQVRHKVAVSVYIWGHSIRNMCIDRIEACVKLLRQFRLADAFELLQICMILLSKPSNCQNNFSNEAKKL